MGRFYREAVASLNRYSSGWAGYVWCYGGGYCAVDERGRFRTNKEQTATPYAPAVAGTVRSDTYDAGTRTYRLAYRASVRPGVTELSLPPSSRGWRLSVTGPARVLGDGTRGGRPVVVARPGSEVVVTVREAGPYGRTDHP
ncbi:endoglycosylceramidase [Streptomyces sp. Termitarium-T10T-6]|nr:endoglycosylceramidase [Streptomyces sp. Termitarium-T10T-6]